MPSGIDDFKGSKEKRELWCEENICSWKHQTQTEKIQNVSFMILLKGAGGRSGFIHSGTLSKDYSPAAQIGARARDSPKQILTQDYSTIS